MSKKPKLKPDDPEEYKRFLETAEEIEASDDPADLERTLKRIAPLPKDVRSGAA